MAQFYGTVQGDKGQASRTGHTLLHVTARSYEGDIEITLRKSAQGDEVSIRVRPHGNNNGMAADGTLLYTGLIVDLLHMEKRSAMMHALGIQKFTEG